METPTLSVDTDATVEERLTDNAQHNILPARYLLKDSDGEIIESPAGMYERVAENVAGAEDEYKWGLDAAEAKEKFESAMKELRFQPNSPTLMNAGTDMNQLSACFVIEPEDKMGEEDDSKFGEGIFPTATEASRIFQSGGGVGYPFHHLRPKGSYINSTGGEASGPVSFMRIFDETCNQVKQGGKRRGAQMGILRVDHPDVGRFAVAKRDEGEFDNFNISVAVTDEFVEAVEEDETFSLYDPTADYDEPFEVTEEVAKFYNYEYHDNPESAFDTGEGETVDENIWRDYADDIEVRENGVHVTLEEKWARGFELEPGEPMELPARFLWDIMVDGAYRNGEPGIFHYDWTNEDHTFSEDRDEYGIEATNPSLVSGTQVLTDNGVVPIEELEDTTFKTRSLNNNWAEASCWKSGNDEELYEITTNTGFTYEATPQHEWPVVSDGTVSKKRSDELEEGDWVPLTETDSLEYGSDGEYSDGLLVGWLYGDGSITERAEDNRADFQYGFTISQEDADAGILEFIVQKLKEITGTEYSPTKRNRGGEDWYEIHACNEDIVEYMNSFDVFDKSSGIPDSIWSNASEKFRKGFVDGLFSADGSVSKQNSRVTLTTSRSQIAKDVVSLLSYYGVKAQQREDVSELDGEEYERHDVTISNTPALRFRKLFKFSHDNKQQALENLSENNYRTVKSNCVKIDSVNKLDNTADVWDISVLDESHTFPIAGITTGNCAEQPLSEYEACNLGHINLSLMLDDDAPTYEEYFERPGISDTGQKLVKSYVKEALDTEALSETIYTGTRFLENVVEQSNFPLDAIEETVDSQRKIGLGVMGLAQMLYQMGVAYDSEVGRDISAEVMRIINRESALVSNEIAHERGVFDAWADSKWANPTEHEEWFERHTGGLNADDWEGGFPVRNHNQTTIAPTGTTSMLGDTSGGCEPVYSVAFYKNVGGDIQGDDFLVEFDSYFLKTLEANDIDVEAVKEEAESQMEADEFDGVEGLDTVPDEFGKVFVTTEQIASEDHTLMQRRLQKHVDSGISKTINLPAEATRADVESAYQLALSEAAPGKPAKGITVYRDGSRDEQVKSTSADMSEAGSEDDMEALFGVDDLEEKLVSLYQSDEISDEAVSKLVKEHDLALTERMDAELCPECHESVMQKQESCSLCTECGYSPCS